jgi:hypothetical protein
MTTMNSIRQLYMIAGVQAIDYAEVAIRSLVANCVDTVSLTVLTDSAADKRRYKDLLSCIETSAEMRVFDESECAERAEVFFARTPNIREFRKGHPCWRKITDPSLFIEDGDEVIIVDPDLVFPNTFTFEATSPGRLLLMRQHRHCLLPPQVVETAFGANIKLAHHTDIGVAHHTVLPWEWIDRTIGKLGGRGLPRVPHVESIVWAAIAMEIGGGYLDPSKWACWERTVGKRILMMGGLKGHGLLKLEGIARLKCFHASSGASNWVVAANAQGLFKKGRAQRDPSPIAPFIEITRQQYDQGERLKRGYHAALRTLRLTDPLQSGAHY